MSRPYCSRYTDTSRDIGFVVLILLAGTVYIHRVVMMEIMRYALITVILISLIIGIVLLLRLANKIRRLISRPAAVDMQAIDTMDGLTFEKYIAKLLKASGYSNVQLTEEYDYGVDIIADKDGIRWGIQVKRHTGLVKANAVRQVVTALNIYGCDKAMVIANNSYSNVAITLAESNNCVLIGRYELTKWVNSLATIQQRNETL